MMKKTQPAAHNRNCMSENRNILEELTESEMMMILGGFGTSESLATQFMDGASYQQQQQLGTSYQQQQQHQMIINAGGYGIQYQQQIQI